MSRIACLAMLFLASMGATSADMPPRPGVREHALAERVRAAGHACPEPATYTYLDEKQGKEFRDQGMTPARVVCNDGKVFLVAFTQHGRLGKSWPSDKPPVVRPLK